MCESAILGLRTILCEVTKSLLLDLENMVNDNNSFIMTIVGPKLAAD